MSRIKADNINFKEDFFVPVSDGSGNSKTEEEKKLILSAESEAKQIIEKAKSECVNLIEQAKEQAKAEIAEMANQGRQEGFEAGKQQGLRAITEELSDKIYAVNNFAKGSFELKDAIIKSAHTDIVSLVIQIAKKVCSKSLELDNRILEEITLKAIHSLQEKEKINIIVNPEMAEKIYSISDTLKEKIPQLNSIKVIEDNSVSPDGTIVESPMSRVDCRISSQINELADKLLTALNSAKTSELMPSEDAQPINEQVETVEDIEAVENIELNENSEEESINLTIETEDINIPESSETPDNTENIE